MSAPPLFDEKGGNRLKRSNATAFVAAGSTPSTATAASALSSSASTSASDWNRDRDLPSKKHKASASSSSSSSSSSATNSPSRATVLIECQPRLESALEYALGQWIPLTVPGTTAKGEKVRTKQPMFQILLEYCNAVEFALEQDVLSERFHGNEPVHCTNVRRMWFLWKYVLDWSMSCDNFVLLRQQVPLAQRFMDYATPDFDDSEPRSAIQNALEALTNETQIRCVNIRKVLPRKVGATDGRLCCLDVNWYSEAIQTRFQLASGRSDPQLYRGDDDFAHANHLFSQHVEPSWIRCEATAIVYSMQMLAMLFIMRCGLISIPLQTSAVQFAMDLQCLAVQETMEWVSQSRLWSCDEFTPLIIHILTRCGNAQALKNIMEHVDDSDTPITWLKFEDYMNTHYNTGCALAIERCYPRRVRTGPRRCKRVKAMDAMFTEFAQKVDVLNPMCNQSRQAIREYNIEPLFRADFGEELYPWWDKELHDGAYDGVVGEWTAEDDKELEKPFVPIPMPIPSDDESLDALGRPPEGEEDDGKENAEPQSPLSDAQRAGLGLNLT